MPRCTAHFTVDLRPGDPLLPDTSRLDGTKDWTGEMTGASTLTMLAAGDQSSGSAGYVALERFEGSVAGRAGTCVLQQYGLMTAGAGELTYAVVPGSGTGELTGLQGTLSLGGDDGHTVTFDYDLP